MAVRLLITSTDLMMVQFLVPHIAMLRENGYDIEVACSDVGGRMDEVFYKLDNNVKKVHVVSLHRSPAEIDNIKGYYDLKRIIKNGHYDVIWTNEPVMGVVTRLAASKARKKGTKVLYMTHGFHFYRGAPILNWLIFYPIERFMATKTDAICTINREDYESAKSFNVKRVEHIHGIGINTERLTIGNNRIDIRSELGMKKDDYLILSVGELNENKNQKTIIEAIAKIEDKSIHYVVCGKGDQLENLQKLAKKVGIKERVHFLGYRKDVVDICRQSDLFAFPSIREGLGLAALEAMYVGIPLITSNSRGPNDFMEDGVSGYLCGARDVFNFSIGIRKLRNNPEIGKRMGLHNKEAVKPYCLDHVQKEILAVITKTALDRMP